MVAYLLFYGSKQISSIVQYFVLVKNISNNTINMYGQSDLRFYNISTCDWTGILFCINLPCQPSRLVLTCLAKIEWIKLDFNFQFIRAWVIQINVIYILCQCLLRGAVMPNGEELCQAIGWWLVSLFIIINQGLVWTKLQNVIIGPNEAGALDSNTNRMKSERMVKLINGRHMRFISLRD